MQTLHPGSEVHDGQTEQARVYAQEVRSLRQRVAVLEAELAAAKAAEQLAKTPPITSIDFAPPTPASKPPPVLSHMIVASSEPPSVFTESVTPAVMAVLPKNAAPVAQPPASTSPSATASTTSTAEESVEATSANPAAVESNPGFAEAWGQEPEATFAEQVAEKAFFEATSVDEESRSWLLDS